MWVSSLCSNSGNFDISPDLDALPCHCHRTFQIFARSGCYLLAMSVGPLTFVHIWVYSPLRASRTFDLYPHQGVISSQCQWVLGILSINLFQIWVSSPHNASGYFTVYGEESLHHDHFEARLETGDTHNTYARTGFLGFVRRTEMTQSDGGEL